MFCMQRPVSSPDGPTIATTSRAPRTFPGS